MTWPSGPRLVWDCAGSPARASLTVDAVTAVCALCGDTTTGTAATAAVLGGNFVDQYLLARPDSARVCYGCAWVCGGRPPDTVRMWTVLADPAGGLPASHPKAVMGTDRLLCTARNDMRAVVDRLTEPPDRPWLLSVAESGQKHHVPFARINGAGPWTVRMDAVDITAGPDEFRDVLALALAAKTLGFRADAIEAGQLPLAVLKTADDIDTAAHLMRLLQPWAGSPLLHLTVFLLNKEHHEHYLTRYGRPDLVSGAPRRPARPADRALDTRRPGPVAPRRDARLGRGGGDTSADGVLVAGRDGAAGGGEQDPLF